MFEAIQISRDTESGKAFLQTKVRNLSSAAISSFKAKLTCNYKDGSAEEFEIEPLDADIAPCGEYTVKPVLLSKGDAVGAGAIVQSVSTEVTDWTSSTDALPLPKRKKLNLSKEALSEKVLLLQKRGCKKANEAASYSYDEHDSWVLCPCGQVNMDTAKCINCNLPFDDPVLRGDDEYFLNSANFRKNQALEEKEKLEKEKQEQRAKLKKKIPLIAVAIIVLVALGITYSLGYLGGQPQADRLAKERTAQLVQDTKANLSPFTGAIGSEVTKDSSGKRKMKVDPEVWYSRSSVMLMGVEGEIEFYAENGKCNEMEWTSKTTQNRSETLKFIDSLESYFGEEAGLTQKENTSGDSWDQKYTWNDAEANCEVVLEYNNTGKDTDEKITVVWTSK